MGTGDGASAESSTADPHASQDPRVSLQVRPGDRTLGLSWAPPVNPGGTSVSAYDVSINGGRNWRRVRTVLAGGRLSTRVDGVRNGASYSVMVRALNAAGHGVSSDAALTRTAQWFRDPLSAATRSRQIAVPDRPNSYRGPLRHTRATARSHDGTLAMSGTSLGARKLQSGQAATVRYGPLFAYNSAVLSAGGRTQVKSMVRSLTYVKAVTCEGNADFGGRKAWEDSSPRSVRPSSARHCVPTARRSRLPCAATGATSPSPSAATVPNAPTTDAWSCASPGGDRGGYRLGGGPRLNR